MSPCALSGRRFFLAYALTEIFSTLTGGRLGFRILASDAASLLRQQVAPKVRSVLLEAEEILSTFEEAEARGVRGGAIYDCLHLVAARKAGAKKFHTLNLGDFLLSQRPGDPENPPTLNCENSRQYVFSMRPYQ
jgi:predicted nucleic acid-binding protein